MVKGKKPSTSVQEQRRLTEILKAQNTTRGAELLSTNVSGAHKLETRSDTFSLPIVDIKKDLVKNAVFALVSLVAIVALSKTNIGLNYLAGKLHI